MKLVLGNMKCFWYIDVVNIGGHHALRLRLDAKKLASLSALTMLSLISPLARFALSAFFS
jgi:hypothetical protein